MRGHVLKSLFAFACLVRGTQGTTLMRSHAEVDDRRTWSGSAMEDALGVQRRIASRLRWRSINGSVASQDAWQSVYDDIASECQQGLPTHSDVAAWESVYDALNGSSWKYCAGARQNPCSCHEQQMIKICCKHDGRRLRIKAMILSSNDMAGTFPVALCSLTGLQTLWLDDNYISGTLPPCIRNLHAMELFQMSQNLLHGPLPANLGQAMPALRMVALYENEVYTSSQGPHCKQLYRVSKDGRDANYPRDWSCGGISGDLFVSLRGATALQDLSVDSNSFRGSVPPWMCEAFPRLWRLDIFDNPFSGTLPMSLVHCRALRIFQVAATTIRGFLPPLCNLMTWDISGLGLDLAHSASKCDATAPERFRSGTNS